MTVGETGPIDTTHDLATAAVAALRMRAMELSLRIVTGMSTRVLPAVDGAGVTLADDSGHRSVAQTDQWVAEIDAIQAELREGPCLSALANGRPQNADLTSGQGWPDFRTRAGEQGIVAVLSNPILSDGRPVAVLNLYSRSAPFSDAEMALSVALAEEAGAAMHIAELAELSDQAADQLRDALISRQVIGQAMGILMERAQCGSPEAFDILRRTSQAANVKLRQIAEQIVGSVGSPPAT